MKIRLQSRLRLMPVVIALGAGLFMLKTSGLVHEAQAEEVTAAAHKPQPKADLAGPDEQNPSASEVDLLAALGKRRSELDSRTRDLDMRANLLSATEKRVDEKIAQLKELQAQMTKLLNARDTEQQKQVASLVKTYSAMKAKAAADIFASLDDEVLVPVAQDMKSDVLAPILAAMPPAAAQRLTVKLANRLMLPKAPPAPPTALTPEANVMAPDAQSEAITPANMPAQKQAQATAPETTKPVQLAAKEPAAKAAETKPAAGAPKVEAKPVAAKTEQLAAKAPLAPSVKADAKPVVPASADAKAVAKPEIKAEAPPPAAPTAAAPAAPTAPAAPPAATIH